MPLRRTLSLKREVLQELTAADLTAIAGAAPPQTTKLAETMYSCLAYISCNVLQCVVIAVTNACLD
jgi:hypothetical protein